MCYLLLEFIYFLILSERVGHLSSLLGINLKLFHRLDEGLELSRGKRTQISTKMGMKIKMGRRTTESTGCERQISGCQEHGRFQMVCLFHHF